MNNKNLLSYALLAFALAFIALPIYVYLPNYYADNFAINLKTIAIILLVTRLIDTIQDPIFGIISDRFYYAKKAIICYLSPFLGLSFLLLFYPLDMFNIELWLIIFLIITYSLFSMIYMNYQSYAVSFSKDYHFKTKIIAYREVFFILGIICAATSPALLFKYFSEYDTFFIIGVAYIILIMICAIVFYFKVPENKYHDKKHNYNIKIILQNRQLRKYFLMFFFNALASSIPAVLIIFFVENIIESKNLLGIFLLLYFIALLLGVVFWTKISRILNDKIGSFMIAMLFTAVIFIWCYFLQAGDIIFYGLICILSGFGFGGDFALSYSILTDLIQKYKLQDSETTIFAISNFLIKISLTIASASLIYIIASLESNIASQKQFISFAYALLPILFRILAAFTLYKYFKHK